MGGDMGDFPSSNDLKKVDRTSFSPHILGNDGGQPSDKPFPIELFFFLMVLRAQSGMMYRTPHVWLLGWLLGWFSVRFTIVYHFS
jgi:hypothetical protein